MTRATAKDHYDTKARSNNGPVERSRLQGFHNHAKRALLQKFAAGAHSLLDLACGRGGDLHKWRALNIPHVLGLDVSADSVMEARARLAKSACPYDYKFVNHDLRQGWSSDAGFDVVTCMFALHYFFETEEVARRVMRTVAEALKPGGYFLGIVPDALQVNQRIKHGLFDNGVFKVAALWDGKPACFGSAYTCSIRGTVTEGSCVPEYLVYANVLEALAAAHGLAPVPIRDAAFHSGRVFHSLRPPYDGPEQECTALYAAFAFQRMCICETQ